MMAENKYHTFSEEELEVLAFLKNIKQYAPENFSYLIFYGASAQEMIKFLEYPEKFGDFDFRFVCSLFSAIHKTFQYCTLPQPHIPSQTIEDKILASVLINSNDAFKPLYINQKLINKSHLIAYLLRKDVLEKWNSWLLLTVQRKVEEIKAEMKRQFEIAV